MKVTRTVGVTSHRDVGRVTVTVMVTVVVSVCDPQDGVPGSGSVLGPPAGRGPE